MENVKVEQVKLVIKDMNLKDSERGKRGGRKESRIHFFHDGENVLQDIFNRHDRPYTLYKQLIPDVLKAIGAPEDAKVSWNQYAGCSCPCSPGFIVKGFYGQNAYVTIGVKEVKEG